MNMFEFDDGRENGQGRAPEWDAARRTLAHAAPPDAVEQALLRAFARQHAPRPWYRRWSAEAIASWAGIGAVGCALAIVGMSLLSDGAPSARIVPVLAAADDGFVSLVPPERMAAAVDPQLKQADLPRAALVQMGIPIVANVPDELVHTEMMVAATGEPLAIRLAVN
jgi:anti-sigma factor RsiW